MFFKVVLIAASLFFSGCFDHFQRLRQTAVIENPTKACSAELEKKILKLSNIKSAELSDLFVKEPYLVLTNRPKVPYPHEQKPHAVPGSEKFFMLYLDGEECYVGLLNEMEYVTHREKIDRCNCKISGKR